VGGDGSKVVHREIPFIHSVPMTVVTVFDKNRFDFFIEPRFSLRRRPQEGSETENNEKNAEKPAHGLPEKPTSLLEELSWRNS
jgi:hypothetical protein